MFSFFLLVNFLPVKLFKKELPLLLSLFLKLDIEFKIDYLFFKMCQCAEDGSLFIHKIEFCQCDQVRENVHILNVLNSHCISRLYNACTYLISLYDDPKSSSLFKIYIKFAYLK